MQKIYLTPGPSQLYFTVEEHMKKAFLHLNFVGIEVQELSNLIKLIGECAIHQMIRTGVNAVL